MIHHARMDFCNRIDDLAFIQSFQEKCRRVQATVGDARGDRSCVSLDHSRVVPVHIRVARIASSGHYLEHVVFSHCFLF